MAHTMEMLPYLISGHLCSSDRDPHPQLDLQSLISSRFRHLLENESQQLILNSVKDSRCDYSPISTKQLRSGIWPKAEENFSANRRKEGNVAPRLRGNMGKYFLYQYAICIWTKGQ